MRAASAISANGASASSHCAGVEVGASCASAHAPSHHTADTAGGSSARAVRTRTSTKRRTGPASVPKTVKPSSRATSTRSVEDSTAKPSRRMSTTTAEASPVDMAITVAAPRSATCMSCPYTCPDTTSRAVLPDAAAPRCHSPANRSSSLAKAKPRASAHARRSRRSRRDAPGSCRPGWGASTSEGSRSRASAFHNHRPAASDTSARRISRYAIGNRC
ncbi:hypothetical protein [Corynebacterium bouchesdurhonense]|uniref:hypothetical protein n=1 Tax=Corynebacterium bouchesdurhonense TaxID=1720192 RepID=UPI0008306573|nr:hypothetical protein [Corynebacterium bouchesdurhonense]